ncbi:hypothetical protein [Nocardiopsis sp. L17-MgMaSL7]|uniref:hypothetical protein n=1 Tax=Nocardiopsis sp. L17-MgMaSL7 TaxID=1938893 RepID=UPI000D71AFF5|nr:hypothetical protein [Nocardiopsis sp. L17-MgMaSL7]PWV44571.1 hypothetical protein BDW27_12330 [Nocardiopsis sp. L17-MgMaSL7]
MTITAQAQQMDTPDPVSELSTHAPVRTSSLRALRHALRVMERRHGATITITPHTREDMVRLLFLATDGHTTSTAATADYPSVVQALVELDHHERLMVCGTPHVTRIGQRTRPRKQAVCGVAFAVRGGDPDGTVWRCQGCKAKKARRR